MNLDYFEDDEVEVYYCDNCDTYVDISISYEIDCLLSDGDWIRHEVSLTDRKYFKSVMNCIKDRGQQIISVSKKETQVRFEDMEVEDFLKLLEKNGITL